MSIEIPTTGERLGIKHEEIGHLEEPMKKIFKELLPNIEKGDYDLIIGIDASGRIPTLIVGKLINYVYAKKGNEFPKTRFLAGSGKKESAEEQINKWNPQKKVLIVEDTILSGSSIKFLANILKEKGIHFDIASISTWGSIENERQRLRLGSDNIYIGTSDSTDIYKARHLGGVKKEQGDTFARPYKKTVEGERGNIPPHVQETINEARNEADIVVDQLIDWYESQKHEGE